MVDWLARHGVSEVIVACGFRADLLRERAGRRGGLGPAIRYVEEPEPLGTAGPLRLVDAEIGLADEFLMLNGDVLTDLDLTLADRSHEAAGGDRHARALPGRGHHAPTGWSSPPRRRGGGVPREARPAEVVTDQINAGAYVLRRERARPDP